MKGRSFTFLTRFAVRTQESRYSESLVVHAVLFETVRVVLLRRPSNCFGEPAKMPDKPHGPKRPHGPMENATEPAAHACSPLWLLLFCPTNTFYIYSPTNTFYILRLRLPTPDAECIIFRKLLKSARSQLGVSNTHTLFHISCDHAQQPSLWPHVAS